MIQHAKDTQNLEIPRIHFMPATFGIESTVESQEFVRVVQCAGFPLIRRILTFSSQGNQSETKGVGLDQGEMFQFQVWGMCREKNLVFHLVLLFDFD